MRVDLEEFDGDIRYAEYSTFKVADEADEYRLLIEGYNGTAGDSMDESGKPAKQEPITTCDAINQLTHAHLIANLYITETRSMLFFLPNIIKIVP